MNSIEEIIQKKKNNQFNNQYSNQNPNVNIVPNQFINQQGQQYDPRYIQQMMMYQQYQLYGNNPQYFASQNTMYPNYKGNQNINNYYGNF